MFKKVALVFGIVFTLVGILGFVPALTPTVDGEPALLGIFTVGTLHNLIHLASGLVALGVSMRNDYSRLYLQIFGVVYALVAVVGLLQGNTILGLMSVNMADNLLHVVLAIALLGAGFGLRSEGGAKAAA